MVKIFTFQTPMESDSTIQYAVNISAATMLKSHYRIHDLELTCALFEIGLKETEFESHKHATGSYSGAFKVTRTSISCSAQG